MHSVRVGGLAAAATNLAETLARNHEVHYFTLGMQGQQKNEVINNVHYHRCFPAGSNIVEYCKNMSLEMVNDFYGEERIGEFDILHFHDWHPTEALHVLQDRRTVLTFHSTEYGRNGNAFGDWWEFKEISGKEWYAALKVGKITTVSNSLKNEIMWLYNVPEWKVKVTPNGIHPDRFSMDVDPGEVKKEYGIHPLAPLIFFMGRIVHQKGPDLLIDAAPEILNRRWDTRFLFAGDGDMRPYLVDKTSKYNGLIRFLGYLPDNEFVKLLNASDLVVIPSRNEPFGLVLLEAWSAKKCVVATNVGGLSENIDNFENGVKVYVTPESIAWGVNYVLDSNCLEEMGMKGREKVERRFRWRSVAREMARTYRGI